MADDHDDNDNGDDNGREALPAVSRLGRVGNRRYRVLSRATDRYRYPRLRKQLPLEELIGQLIRQHGLTDEVRQRFVCLYWPEIAGERVASKTFPVAFADGVLRVSASSSPWVHEMQFFKAQLIAQINSWVDANRVWLGPPPLVTDMRFILTMRQREPLVDREHARRLRLRHLQRVRPRVDVIPPTVSDADREAIRTETNKIVDSELRAVIETVRMKWNR
jgi:predicted nucleic acid-binding Zn ribbon protein